MTNCPRYEEAREGGMTKPEHQAEPFFLTEDVAAELAAAGYECKPPSHARTKSVRNLYGW